jgi:hypothetical protein
MAAPGVAHAALKVALQRVSARPLSGSLPRGRAPPLLKLVSRPHFFSRVDASAGADDSSRHELIPTFRCLDGQGNLLDESGDLGVESIPSDRLVKMYEVGHAALPISHQLITARRP